MRKWLDWNLEGRSWWRIVLRGAAIPGLVVAGMILAAVILSFFETGDPRNYIAGGIFFGLFLTLWGGIEFMILLLLQSKDVRTNSFLALGYGITWAICVYFIFGVLL